MSSMPATHDDIHDLRATVQQHDRDLALIRRDIAGVQTAVLTIDSKMDKLVTAVSDARSTTAAAAASLQASSNRSPFEKFLSIAVPATTLFAMLTAGIVYLASNITAVEIALLKERIANRPATTSKSNWADVPVIVLPPATKPKE